MPPLTGELNGSLFSMGERGHSGVPAVSGERNGYLLSIGWPRRDTPLSLLFEGEQNGPWSEEYFAVLSVLWEQNGYPPRVGGVGLFCGACSLIRYFLVGGIGVFCGA